MKLDTFLARLALASVAAFLAIFAFEAAALALFAAAASTLLLLIAATDYGPRYHYALPVSRSRVPARARSTEAMPLAA